MRVGCLLPNDETVALGNALQEAVQCDVELLVLDCYVTRESIAAHMPVEIRL